MKGFIVFFSIFLSIYGLVNFYIYLRGFQALPRDVTIRAVYTGLFIVLALSFIAGRFLERLTVCPASTALIWIGSFWLGAMLYLFLGALLVDIARAADHLFGIFPRTIARNHDHAKLAALAAVTFVTAVVLAVGYVNSVRPKITRLDLHIDKFVPGVSGLDLAVATDIHLGILISNSRLQRLVDGINGLRPDIVLLAGDIVDEDMAPVIQNNLGETLRSLRAPLGVYAVTGNHEYIGGVENAVRYLSDHGITFLRDAAVKAGGVILAGREDRSAPRFTGYRRRELAGILAGIDRRLPIILMDHQPFELEQAVRNGVDLQISGHTHNGQLWPFNFITRKIYRISYGYGLFGSTHIYVSDGYGTWGPPVRTVNRPEIVHIHLTFAGGHAKK